MDDIKHNYEAINIPIALACDGNRRKELNMVKKSKGFGWGPGGVSCAYWRGPRLRDILLSAGVPEALPNDGSTTKRHWVHFEGADELSEGKYATCIPFEYAMDPANDVMLAYEMNDVALPPDHGYPIRLMIPGYVGGRCVKWLRRIWISDKENDSHYHIWDNRVLPAFVTDMESEFAEVLFNHPDTACNEQVLNSVIAKPAQGERISFSAARPGSSYRVEGYAYDGGGRQIQRVEVSLDGGDTWLYCIRRYPDRPIRHSYKFWAWLHWHVDIDIMALLQAKSITVRAFNSSQQTQPEKPVWNIMGMMNNCWYVVRPELVKDESSGGFATLFRHPTEPGTGSGGWMKPSVENEMGKVKREASTPHKEFTRREIEKHNREDDCWIVVDGKVYDATSVLGWHPGGKAAIMNHAGKVHGETGDEFSSIHDDFAYNKLNECVLGVVTQKARRFIDEEAKEREKTKAGREAGNQQLALEEHRWVPVTLISRREVSEDTRTYTFRLPDGKKMLGIGTCQHVQVGFHMKDKMLIRSYTPTRPVLPPSDAPAAEHADAAERLNADEQRNRDGDDTSPSLRDGIGEFDLTVKTYFPNDSQPGGALSNILDCIPIGEEVEIRGPVGDITYHGFGNFVIEGKQRHFERVSLVLGGSGITPCYALIARIALTAGDTTRVNVIDANKSERDILLRDELERFEQRADGRIRVSHILSHPTEGWKGRKGLIDADTMRALLFPPSKRDIALLCGPPAMIEKVVLPALRDWGYAGDENLFGF